MEKGEKITLEVEASRNT